jgi:C4-dicarboxylate-specific signal transduction histidine kinase
LTPELWVALAAVVFTGLVALIGAVSASAELFSRWWDYRLAKNKRIRDLQEANRSLERKMEDQRLGLTKSVRHWEDRYWKLHESVGGS